MDATEYAFLDLKEQLEALSYDEPLGLESAPLVSHLLGDLLLTTENYEVLRSRAEAAERSAAQAAGDAAPMRMEIARLTRECDEVRRRGPARGGRKRGARSR